MSGLKRLFAKHGFGIVGALGAIALALGFVLSQPRTFPLDDAYIHLAYGRSLAQSGVLGLNPGEPSLGTSSPLWSIFLAALFLVFGQPYWSVHALSFVGVAAYVVLGALFAGRAIDHVGLPPLETRVAKALGVLLLCTNGSLLWMSLSGMETCLVLGLCAMTIACYFRFGPGVLTGVAIGACLLGRTTTVALVAALALVEIAGPRRLRRSAVALGCAAAVYAPYALYSFKVSGSFLPNTAKGKLLTYVRGDLAPEDWLHYWGRALAFHKYLPAYPVLGACILIGILVSRRRRPSEGTLQDRVRGRFLVAPALAPLVVFGSWAILHVAEYTLAFRTIGQQGRYLAEWLFAVGVVGAFAVAYCTRLLAARATRLAFLAAIAVAQLSTLPYWSRVYRHNLAHVEDTYVQMARYIHDNTPADARVATFDIGTIRYLGDRYTIDLGGLVDTSTHDCLRERSCGEYVRKSGATYLMYPKDPESDKLTGVQQAEFASRHALREIFVTRFQTPDYAAPTLTHSFDLQLFRIDGWYDRTVPGQAVQAFREEPPNPAFPLVAAPASTADFAIVAYRTDLRDLRYIREYPYTATLWIAYKATKPVTHPQWLHILLLDDDARWPIMWSDNLVTEGLVLPSQWPVGEVLEEHRVFDVPWDQRHPHYRLLVSVNEERIIDVRYPDLYSWIDLGVVTVTRSATTALAPL